MAKSDRIGNRKPRSAIQKLRAPELGYYFIFTDTKETEQNYFHGIRDIIPTHLKDKLVIRVNRSATVDLISQCKEALSLEPQYRIPWIIFDRDQLANFDSIISEAERSGIQVGWSNPCIEIWFHAYFGAMPTCFNSTQCCDAFGDSFEKIAGHKYKKSDKGIYADLCYYGNEAQALVIADQKYQENIRDGNTIPSSMSPCTTVHKLVEEIRSKLDERK